MPSARLRLSAVAVHVSAGAQQLDAEEYDRKAAPYREDGVRRALELGNRGPIQFDDDGRLSAEILEKYWECGFYVFTGVLSAEEVHELQEDVRVMLDQAPVDKDSTVDRHGNVVAHP